MRGQKNKLSNKSPVDGFPSNYCGRKTVMSLTDLGMSVVSFAQTIRRHAWRVSSAGEPATFRGHRAVTGTCNQVNKPTPVDDIDIFTQSKSHKMYNSSYVLTHWGRVTHVCVSKLTIIGPDNGLSPGRRQAIIWTEDGILLIRPLGTNFSEILIESHSFSFKEMHLKMSSGKWRPFCLGFNVLRGPLLKSCECNRSSINKGNSKGFDSWLCNLKWDPNRFFSPQCDPGIWQMTSRNKLFHAHKIMFIIAINEFNWGCHPEMLKFEAKSLIFRLRRH